MYKLLFKPYHSNLVENFLTEETRIRSPKVFQERKNNLMNFRGNINYGEHKLFQDWLFSQGIMLKRENKKLYLQFLDEHQALMFTLKWGAQ